MPVFKETHIPSSGKARQRRVLLQSLALVPFALDQVRLLPGSFQHAQTLDGRYLLSLSPDI